MESHKTWVRTSVRWLAVAAAAGLFTDPALAQTRAAAKEAATAAVQGASRNMVVDRRPASDGAKENLYRTALKRRTEPDTPAADTPGTPPSNRNGTDGARGRGSESGSRSRDDGRIGPNHGGVVKGFVVPPERPAATNDSSVPIIAGLRAEIVQQTQLTGSLQEKVNALATTNDRLNRDLTNERGATTQQLRLRQDNDGLRQTIDRLRQENDGQRQAIARTNQILADRDRALRDLQAENQKTESALRDAIAQRGQREATLQTKLDRALADSKNDRDEVGALRSQLDALRSQFDRIHRMQWLWVAATALIGLAAGGVAGRFFKQPSPNPAVRPMSLRVSAGDWWMHVDPMASESLPAFSIRTQLMPVAARMQVAERPRAMNHSSFGGL